MNLPLANILHHKLRSAISVIGIGIAVCMLITLTGLSRGSIDEIAERMESVDADLVVVPAGASENAPTLNGMVLREKMGEIIRKKFPDLVDRCVPVFVATMKLGGQDQRVTALRPADWDIIAGKHALKEGRVFDPENRFGKWIENLKMGPVSEDEDEEDHELLTISASDLSDPSHNGMEIVIDDRLARSGKYKCGQKVKAANHEWTITGIVETGVATRVFMPIRTAQELFGIGDITKCTMIFVKLKSLPKGMTQSQAAQTIGKTLNIDTMPLERYRGTLEQKFGILFTYVNVVNIIAMTIAFLFVMNTLYTMVLHRTREIAILKSCGASAGFILSQIIVESMALTSIGAIFGIGLSFSAGWAIEHFKPLLTVDITGEWIVIALVSSIVGSVVAALYPAWSAMRIDMVEALRDE